MDFNIIIMPLKEAKAQVIPYFCSVAWHLWPSKLYTVWPGSDALQVQTNQSECAAQQKLLTHTPPTSDSPPILFRLFTPFGK